MECEFSSQSLKLFLFRNRVCFMHNGKNLLPPLPTGYGLVLTPGFFRFYSLFGALYALTETNLLKVTHCSGSSAGALVATFFASGMY